MDSSSVFILAGDYRKKLIGRQTIEEFFLREPVGEIEKIEFFLEAIRYVHTLQFTEIGTLSDWKNINKKQEIMEAFSHMKNEKLMGYKLYVVAASYLIDAGGEQVFTNLEQKDFIDYYSGKKTIYDLYKGNKYAFDFILKSGEGHTFKTISSVYTVKAEIINDIWDGLGIEDKEDLELMERILKIEGIQAQRMGKCSFIMYIYYKRKGDEKSIEARKKVLDRLSTTDEE